MRQIGTDQEAFRECLGRVSRGDITQVGYDLLRIHFLINNQQTIENTSKSLRLISRNAVIEEYNHDKLRNIGNH